MLRFRFEKVDPLPKRKKKKTKWERSVQILRLVLGVQRFMLPSCRALPIPFVHSSVTEEGGLKRAESERDRWGERERTE